MRFRPLSVTVALALAAIAGRASAQGNNPLITANESGVGSIVFSGVPATNMPGVLAVDPCNAAGGLALTYNLLGPPGLVAGELFFTEVAGGPTSDWIRFNPAGACATPGYQASFVFYSDIADGADALADRAFPPSFYTNTRTFLEVGPEAGPNGLTYTPGVEDPGYVPGFGVTYVFQSDLGSVTPEPATVMLMGTGLVTLAGAAVRRRNRLG